MKYCNQCGAELVDQAVICPSCGASQGSVSGSSAADHKSFGYALLGFCIPIVGLILWLVWKDSTPLRASSAGKGALISFILGIVFLIIYVVFIVVLVGAGIGAGSYYY